MLFNLRSYQSLQTISVVALSFCMAITTSISQKASAQQALIDGVGASSVSVSSLLDNWYGEATISLEQNSRSYDADGDGIVEASEAFPFHNGLVGSFASYTIAGSENGRNAIIGVQTEGFIFDFYSSTGRAVNNVQGVPIVNVNPVDIQISFPVNTDFDDDGVNDFEVLVNTSQLCRIIRGNITNYNQIGGPDFPIIRVFREGSSGDSEVLGSFVEGFCGFSAFTPDGEVISSNVNLNANDILVPLSQNVRDTVLETPGALGYLDFAFARQNGFTQIDGVGGIPDDYAFTTDFGNPVPNSPLGYVFQTAPNFVGFYQVYDTFAELDAAANLCLYLTQGLDFNGNGVIDGGSESGRLFGQSIGYAAPSRTDLDPNCGTFFTGFGGGQIVPDGPILLPGGAAPIPAPEN
jgi:ABC-type phosphate transport system substrate-binding protein